MFAAQANLINAFSYWRAVHLRIELSHCSSTLHSMCFRLPSPLIQDGKDRGQFLNAQVAAKSGLHAGPRSHKRGRSVVCLGGLALNLASADVFDGDCDPSSPAPCPSAPAQKE